MAGVVPGIDPGDHARRDDLVPRPQERLPAHAKATWGERWKAFRESFWGLMLIVIVMGGIYSGIFTPTEAAAMAAVYAFIVAVFVYKDMRPQGRAEGAARARPT